MESIMPKVNILVCYHKAIPLIIGNEILRPIFLGASNANPKIISKLQSLCDKQKVGKSSVTLWRDDSPISTNTQNNENPTSSIHSFQSPQSPTCPNISTLNPYFCELTAMYWAWKNLDSDYYGLFHYRRVFDLKFDEKNYKNEPITIPLMSFKKIEQQFGLEPQLATQTISKYDIIVSARYKDHHIDSKNNLDYENMCIYEHYKNAHNIRDLDVCINHINEHYPQMRESMQKTLYTKPVRWSIANMFIMKKELYFEYCEWIFDVLFGVQDKIDYKSYDTHAARVFGFLAERLLNIWVNYKAQALPQLKITYAPIIFTPKYRPKFGFEYDSAYKRLFLFGVRVWKSKL